jgi:aryl-alcohol dehydrogenase-like predicted oxidoreductase
MELALGTVQFGLDYGVANTGGKVSAGDARDILKRAWDGGIRRLDTAAAYGDIEERLCDLCGDLPFEIVSKIPAIGAEMGVDAAIDFALAAVERSRSRLGARLTGILFHDAANLSGAGGATVWASVRDALQGSGIRLGSSGYNAADIVDLRQFGGFAMAQLPGNALDQRFLENAADLAGVEMTIRSALLQGLLLMDQSQAAKRVPSAAHAIGEWRTFCAARGLDHAEAAFSIVKGFTGAAYCVIGVDHVDQLDANLSAWSRATPIVAPELASRDLEVIDPRVWPALKEA